MNSDFTNEQAAIFAKQIASSSDNVKEQIASVLQQATQRKPTEEEIERGLEALKLFRADDGVDAQKALEYFCLMALNLNEFVYID